jgi:hypothetical protein
VPDKFPDRVTLERALLAIAPVYGVGSARSGAGVSEHGCDRWRGVPATRWLRRFENRFGYLIAATWTPPWRSGSRADVRIGRRW